MGGPLEDASNRQEAALPLGLRLPLKVFSRQDRKEQVAEASASPAPAVAAPLPAVPEEESWDVPLSEKKPAGRKAGRRGRVDGYSRKAVPSAEEQEAARHKEYFARMRAYFAEVDAFELAVESPAVEGRRPGGSPARLPAAEATRPASPAASAASPESDAEQLRAAASTPWQPALHPLAALDEYEADTPPSSRPCESPGSTPGMETAPAQEPSTRQLRPPPGMAFSRVSLAASRPGTTASKAPSYGLSRRSSIVRPLRPHRGLPTPSAERRSLASQFSAGVSTALHRLSNTSLMRSAARLASPGQARKSAAIAESVGPSRLRPPASPLPAQSGPQAMEEGPRTPLSARPLPIQARAETPMLGAAQAEPMQADVAALAEDVDARLQLEPTAEEEPELSELQLLLRACGMSVDEGAIPSMDALLTEATGGAAVTKIGEGTFGEAFVAASRVLKIVPLGGEALVNGEPQKAAGEIAAEVAIARTLSQLREPDGHPDNVTAAFVETFHVGVCRGPYAPRLAAAWRDWDAAHGSENDPVDDFAADQLFVVFAVAHGGADLERADVRGFDEARSILLQCALALAVAEEACEFEHRDLHWGNILLRRASSRPLRFRLRGVELEVDSAGVEVTLIDFTISRLCTADGGTAFSDLEADPALFAGRKGDCQADTYRRMRKATGGDWGRFTPKTNALWLHYLADLLLTSKRCPCQPEQTRRLRDFRKRMLQCRSSADSVTDEFFVGAWRSS